MKLLRFESIRSIRCDSNLVKSNRFTGSRYSWYMSIGGEVIAIRFDSIDSLRMEPCKVESFYRKLIFLVYEHKGCVFIAIRFDRFVTNRTS